jgi:hypothetical protein
MAEHVAHRAGGGHDAVHDFLGQRELPDPQLVKQVFRQVAERDEFCRIQETGTALDGVKTAKNIVQQPMILRVLFEIDQLVVDTGKQIGGFNQKVL